MNRSWLPACFRPLSLRERVARALAAAELDRLEADEALEMWEARSEMLVRRIDRLKGELRVPPVAAEGSE